jgi:hypothetical protein
MGMGKDFPRGMFTTPGLGYKSIPIPAPHLIIKKKVKTEKNNKKQ